LDAALTHSLSPLRGFLPLESSGCFMRIYHSSRGCIPKRWERFHLRQGGEGWYQGGLNTIIPASLCAVTFF
jgi:hypothetical protein